MDAVLVLVSPCNTDPEAQEPVIVATTFAPGARGPTRVHVTCRMVVSVVHVPPGMVADVTVKSVG